MSVEVGTGRILSMVQSKRFDESGGKGTGGQGYTANAVNWNTDKLYGGSGGFQPGSSYKTFTLIDWLEKGHGLNEVVDGSPRTLPYGALKACGQPAAAFDVGNDTADEGGYQTVYSATQRSVNGAYASMAQKLDLCDIKKRAEELGVHRADGAPLSVVPSSILGINEVAPLTMATAYAGIANKGDFCGSVAIDKIVDSEGKEVPVPKADCHQTTPKTIAIATGHALQGVLTGGTAAADRGATGSAWGFAKTGTTDDAKDTWVVGGTTKTVTAAWVGNLGDRAPRTSLRQLYAFPGCRGSSKASDARHCLWSDIQAANQAKYPGDTSWPQPEDQYLYGQKIAVPDVTGKSVTDAKLALQQAGFQAKVGDETNSDTVEQGLVAATDPPAGSQVTGGSVVTLVRSAGPALPDPTQPDPAAPPAPAQTVPVPSVTGMTLPEARTALTNAGFTQFNAFQAPGAQGEACRVLGQLPLAGTPSDPASTPVMLGLPNDPAQCG